MSEKILAYKTDIVEIADAVRNKTGKSDKLTLAQIADDINEISTGIDTSDATATPSDILSGETAYVNGEKITGTFTIDSELTTQDDLISQIQTALENKASATPILQTKGITPTTTIQTVIPDNGYDGLSQVTVGAIPSDYIIPSGTKTITTNGTHDVKSYASATVNVVGEDVTDDENVETCTLTFLEVEGHNLDIYYTAYENNTIIQTKQYKHEGNEGNQFNIDVLKNSRVSIFATLINEPLAEYQLVFGNGCILEKRHNHISGSYKYDICSIFIQSSCDIEVTLV